jgi:hypothetical protein
LADVLDAADALAILNTALPDVAAVQGTVNFKPTEEAPVLVVARLRQGAAVPAKLPTEELIL